MSLQEWSGAGTTKKNQVLLLTDIVNSTSIGQKLGDDAWIEILVKHFERARDLRDHYNCYEIKLMGDSYMAAFHTAEDALDFAKSFFVDCGHPKIVIRAAIHVGRILIHDNDMYGLSVNYTARMLSAMGGFGIALSDPAKHQVVDALGENVIPKFRKKEVKLKNFGLHTIWMYETPELVAEFWQHHRTPRLTKVPSQ